MYLSYELNLELTKRSACILRPFPSGCEPISLPIHEEEEELSEQDSGGRVSLVTRVCGDRSVMKRFQHGWDTL